MTHINHQPAGSMRSEIFAFKRERILEAAADLFYERGYENTTLEAVADRLGVRKPFIYSYYKSKSDLLAEICQRGIGASLSAMDEVLASENEASEGLRKLGIAFTLAVLRNQKHIAIFSREEKNLLPRDFRRIATMRREFDRKLNDLLDRGCVNAEFSIADRQLAALAIGGMVSWAYVWYRPAGRLSAEAIAERMADLMLTMLGADKKRQDKKSRSEAASTGRNRKGAQRRGSHGGLR